MMQPKIYCQLAETYDVYIKVCCRVTACWAWWHWQITSQVTPSVHDIQNISLWIRRSSKASSADLESSAPLFGINAGALKGQQKIYNGEARPWFEPLTLSLILNEVEGYRAQLWLDLFTFVESLLRLTEVMQFTGGIEWVCYTVYVIGFYGYPSGWASSVEGRLRRQTLTPNNSRFVTCAWNCRGETALKCRREFQHINFKILLKQ